MTGSFKNKLAVAIGRSPEPERPVSEIQLIFDGYVKHMSGKIIKTPIDESVHLRDENFPHWIKLQMFDEKNNCWVDAYSSIVVPLLQARIFTDEGYRMADPRRAPALLNVPDLLRDPNRVLKDNGSDDRFYIQSYRKYYKVAITRLNPFINERVLVSSYPTESLKCFTGMEELYNKLKSRP